MVYQETFLDGLHASTSTIYSGMLNSRDPVQASTRKTRNRKWLVIETTTNLEPKWLKSQTVSQFLVLLFSFPKRPSTGIPTLFQKECIKELERKEVSGFSETLKGK